jgi:hypothetical protein
VPVGFDQRAEPNGWADLSFFFFPVPPWDRLSWALGGALRPLVFLCPTPLPTALRFVWFPGPTEPSDWPCFLKKQFRRTILGSLLIPVNATPGGLSCFGARSAWQLRASCFQQALAERADTGVH